MHECVPSTAGICAAISHILTRARCYIFVVIFNILQRKKEGSILHEYTSTQERTQYWRICGWSMAFSSAISFRAASRSRFDMFRLFIT